ncbi:MAG: adenylosuccinate lyase [Candidatus Omnitrophota bacterium]
MIERYSTAEMKKIWSADNKFEKMTRVEILACEAQSKLGLVPKKDLENIKKKAKFNIKRVEAIEKKTKHDVVAFVTNLAENIGPSGKYIHLGLTSSDVIDTASAVIMKEGCDCLISDLDKLIKVLAEKARKHKNTICIGRSHGIHAEPVTFGLKLALFYEEAKRNLDRLKQAREDIAYAKISGSVGTYANVDPSVEKYVALKLGLKAAPVSNQIIQRDRHAYLLTTLAVLAGSLEKIAVEIRGLQRTEIAEVEEFFSKGQTGSSSMPHKRNPVRSERVCGLARLIRSYAMCALENIALWHERDISHSSNERIIIGDSMTLIDFMLNEAADLIETLVVYPEKMKANLEMSLGMVFSQKLLSKMIGKGLSRQEAYYMVQRNALLADKEKADFKIKILSDKDIRKILPEKEIEESFNLQNHLKNVDYIFKNAGL